MRSVIYLTLKAIFFLLYYVAATALLAIIFEVTLFYSARSIRFGGMWDVVVGLFYAGSVRDVVQFNEECTRHDDELTYTMRPGQCRFRNWEFDTTINVNSLGLRDTEEALIAPEIVVLGDSHAMGWGVESEDSFASQIEKISGIKTLNAAISSYGTARELALLKRLDLSKIKLVIIQYSDNDKSENEEYLRRNGILPRLSKEDLENQFRAHEERIKYFPFKYLTTFFPLLTSKLYENYLLRLADAEAMEESHGMVFLKTILMSKLPIDSFKIVVLSIPALNFQSEVAQLLNTSEFSKLRGIIYPIDIELDSTVHNFKIDEHLNVKGHRHIAEQILLSFKKLNLISTSPPPEVNGYREK